MTPRRDFGAFAFRIRILTFSERALLFKGILISAAAAFSSDTSIMLDLVRRLWRTSLIGSDSEAPNA
ncbi:hypothetical protein D9M72_484640 [compost metagenome]